MDTFLTRSPVKAAGFVKRGGIVAFPTETVYGLAADVFNESAITKIFEAKQRPADNPLIAHIGELRQIERVAAAIPANARKFIEAFFPGPLTIVLPKLPNVPFIATAGLQTIGVRMPRNQTALEFLKSCKGPVVAPSANISGRPSPTTWEAVYEDLNGRIDSILQGNATEIGLESTVVDCTGYEPLLLRAGAISLAELQQVVPETKLYVDVGGEQPKSPGMKHRHYSPTGKVLIVDADKVSDSHAQPAAFIGLKKPQGEFDLVKICKTIDEYAHSLFEFFRECDRRKIKTIFCDAVREEGIGAALMDRLRRAAGQ